MPLQTSTSVRDVRLRRLPAAETPTGSVVPRRNSLFRRLARVLFPQPTLDVATFVRIERAWLPLTVSPERPAAAEPMPFPGL